MSSVVVLLGVEQKTHPTRRIAMAFDKNTIEAVWRKARAPVPDKAHTWRKDQCGAWIARAQYGNRGSDYGWEIDHIKPQSQGGSDALSNLRPLHWMNNASRQDGRLACPAKSSGSKNTFPRT
jgi:5-methylcytosine-specific restriction endonuclease McrA